MSKNGFVLVFNVEIEKLNEICIQKLVEYTTNIIKYLLSKIQYKLRGKL